MNTRVAIVTGATSGIGKAIATSLAASDITVCLLGRNEAKLRQIEQELGPTTKGFAVNLEHQEEINSVAEEIHQQFPSLSLLIHAAGVLTGPNIAEVNVNAPKMLTAALLPFLTPYQADIVFINSSVVRQENSSDLYTQSKQELKKYADELRQQINPQGIRVLSVYPGRTATPMQEQVFEREHRVYHPDDLLQPEDIASTILGAITLPRTAEVTDIYIRPCKKILA